MLRKAIMNKSLSDVVSSLKGALLALLFGGAFCMGVGRARCVGERPARPTSLDIGTAGCFASSVEAPEAFGCSAKNVQMTSVAEIFRVTAPRKGHVSSDEPPGQVCPPPSMA